MGVTKKLKSVEGAKPRSAGASSKTAEAPVVLERKASSQRRGQSSGNDAEKTLRAKILKERFVPETIAYLKENFGLDVQSPAFPVQALRDIGYGFVTQPLEAVLSPKGYDRDNRVEVDLPKIRTVSSFKFVLPQDNDFKPVAPSKDHGVFVQAFPCHDFIMKSSGSSVQEEQQGEQESQAKRNDIKFTNAQLLALEGVGIAGDRVFSGFNALSDEQLAAAYDGVPFEFEGCVKTAAGYMNVAGTATLKEGHDGVPVAVFEPNMPSERHENETLDLLTINKIGNLELDFFERSKMTGEVLKDSHGRPMINRAGRDILSYGISMEPVKGTVHSRIWDDVEKAMRHNNKTDMYQVAVVNGGLMAVKMLKVEEKDEKGEKIMVGSGKYAFAKYHYELDNVRINKDGTVRLSNGVNVSFASDEDALNYRKGKGAKVVGAVWTDYSKGGKGESRTYDAYIVPDPLRGGFARQFSPETSKMLMERDKPKVKKTQNFGVGF